MGDSTISAIAGESPTTSGEGMRTARVALWAKEVPSGSWEPTRTVGRFGFTFELFLSGK